MELTLEILSGCAALELLLWWGPLWRWRKPLAGGLVPLLGALSGWLLTQHLSGWAVLFCVLSAYRVINLLRVVAGRIQPEYLYHVSRQTAWWLIGWQATIVLLAEIGIHYHFDTLPWFYLISLGQLLAGLLILASAGRQLKKTLPPVIAVDGVAERDLPALTVAIPARNETTDLEACLRSLVASHYPKLEILVLDDCSQNKHTPEIIRGFAHDGVRFIAGTPPPDNWLAKNHAYAQLTEAASGELLLFCGVDVRFEPDSLANIVRIMSQKNKTMLSILPRNILAAGGGWRALLWQPSRYAWEMALPRRLVNRPPVLSTCWIIRRQTLKAVGGFAAVARKPVPESYLARQTAATDDGYSFLQSDATIGVTCQKDFIEQRRTAVRTRYPQLHRRPELVALIGLSEFALLVSPFGILTAALINQNLALSLLSGAVCLINISSYCRIVNVTYRRFMLGGLWFLPVAALCDIGLLNYSMWQYEFSEVLWKGRNVCVPVMRVIPRLPRLPPSATRYRG